MRSDDEKNRQNSFRGANKTGGGGGGSGGRGEAGRMINLSWATEDVSAGRAGWARSRPTG